MDPHLTTDVQHAALLSKLSGNPVPIGNDIYAWNGILVNRATAIVVLLRVYSQLPVNDYLKQCLHRSYLMRFHNADHRYLVDYDQDDDRYSVGAASNWFYHISRRIKGSTPVRSEEEIKQLLILLHS